MYSPYHYQNPFGQTFRLRLEDRKGVTRSTYANFGVYPLIPFWLTIIDNHYPHIRSAKILKLAMLIDIGFYSGGIFILFFHMRAKCIGTLILKSFPKHYKHLSTNRNSKAFTSRLAASVQTTEHIRGPLFVVTITTVSL